MLKFVPVTIAFTVILAGLSFLYAYQPFNPLLFFVPAFVYSVFLFYGSFFVCSNFYMKVICSGDTTEKKIAISFDDGPDRDYTPELLNYLKSEGIKATFFLIGNKVQEQPDLAKRIYAEGHLIGNHSWSHSAFFDIYSAAKVRKEIAQTNSIINATLGVQPAIFRPPYGVTNPSIKKAVVNSEMTAMGWTIRSYDSNLNTPPETIIRNVTEKIAPGAVILFHDTNPATVKIVSGVIGKAQEKGFEIVRLDELTKTKAYV